MVGNDRSVQAAEGNEECGIGPQKKIPLHYKVVKDLTELCSCPRVLWKTEIQSQGQDIWLR